MRTHDNKVEREMCWGKMVETTLMIVPLQMKSQVYNINTLPKGVAKQFLEALVL